MQKKNKKELTENSSSEKKFDKKFALESNNIKKDSKQNFYRKGKDKQNSDFLLKHNSLRSTIQQSKPFIQNFGGFQKKILNKRTKFLLRKRIRLKNIEVSNINRGLIGSVKIGSKFKNRSKIETLLLLKKLVVNKNNVVNFSLQKNLTQGIKNKKLVTKFAKSRESNRLQFIHSLVHSGFLNRQDDYRSEVFSIYKPYLSSTLLKQLFILLFHTVSRKTGRLYGFTQDKKLLEFLAVLSSQGKISKFFKIGQSTDLNNWYLSLKKDRVLLLINTFFTSKLLQSMLKRNFNLSYNILPEGNSIREIPNGSFFLANDAAQDFNKSVFLTQFVNKSSHLFFENEHSIKEKYVWLTNQNDYLSRKSFFFKQNNKLINKLFFFRDELFSLKTLKQKDFKESIKKVLTSECKDFSIKTIPVLSTKSSFEGTSFKVKRRVIQKTIVKSYLRSCSRKFKLTRGMFNSKLGNSVLIRKDYIKKSVNPKTHSQRDVKFNKKKVYLPKIEIQIKK